MEFTNVNMPDGTVLRFPSDMPQAEMQAAAASWWSTNGGAPTPNNRRGENETIADYRTRLQQPESQAVPSAASAQMNQDLEASLAPQPQPQERTFGAAVMDNIVGRDDGVTSYGEKAGRLIHALGAGGIRGVEGLANLPFNAMGLAEDYVSRPLYNAITPESMNVPETMSAMPQPRIYTGGGDFEPNNTLEEYAGTVGEFLPGAAALGPSGLLRNILQFGVVPGVASEAAGQATEGTAIEPYARFAAALLSPAALATRAPASTASALRPDASRVNSANYLQQRGVTPTAGQATGSDMLRRLEGAAAPTSQQLDDFTGATMRYIGSNAPRATPEALVAAESAIVQRMDDAIAGIGIRVPQQITQSVDDVMRSYNRHITTGGRSNVFDDMAEELAGFSRNPATPVPATLLRTWRSDIGKLTASTDDAVRDAAHGFRQIIDDLTDSAMRTAGREADIPALAAARQDYRNFIAVRDASTREGAESGTLSPTVLNQAIIRTQGRNNYALGRVTDMADFTRAGAEILRPMATVNPGGVRAIEGAAGTSLGLLGYAAGGGIPAAAAGLVAPTLGRGLLRTPAVQNLLANPATAARAAPALTSGLLGAAGAN